MTATVTPLPQAARPGRCQDRPDPAGAAGFASALDGALSGGREGTGPAAAEQRTGRRQPEDRAADRIERAGEKAAAATERAAEQLARATERAAKKTQRAAERAADEPADAPAPTDDAEATQTPGAEAVPERTGLPAAIWALLMGTTTAAQTTTPATAAPVTDPTAGQSVAVPVVAAPMVEVAANMPAVEAAPPQTAGATSVPQVSATAAAPTAHGPTGAPPPVPSAAPTGADAAALAGLTVVEPTAVATPVATRAVATATQTAAPPSPATATTSAPADAETALPVPPQGAAAQDGGASDGAASEDAGGPPTQAGTVPSPETADAPAPAPSTAVATASVATTTARPATAGGATGAGAAQPVGGQVARQVAVLRGAADGSHTMTLVLTPETLGPVEVQVTVSKGSLDLMLRGAHEHGRAALLDALPDLRRDLEQAGLSVGSAEVDRDTGGSAFSDRSAQNADRQQGFGDRGQQGRGDNRSRPWPGAADTTGGPTPPSQRTTSSGLDVRA